jgi:RNA polymerase sigma factor (sigma-70 family)
MGPVHEDKPRPPLAIVDEAALMSRVAQGDLDAFEQLYDRYKGPLAGFFFRMCWDWAAVEDLVQETFLRLWKSASSYRGQGSLTTYVFQVGKNLWLNEERRRAAGRPQAPVSRPDEMPVAVDQSPGPEEDAERAERRARVRAAVSRLSDEKRLVVEMAEFQGMRYREVAEALGIPIGTVKSRMASAEAALREMLEGE